MKSRVVYNPDLSIKEIAERCGVSESTVRRFIAVNAIDRHGDERLKLFNLVSQYKSKNPDETPRSCCKALNISLNTVKKYWDMNQPPKKEHSDKISAVDKSRNSSVIMSATNNQNEILSSILRLYLKNASTFECDLTANVCGFYKRGIPVPPHLFDKYPQMAGVRPLEEALQLPDECFNSIVIDLPFLVDTRNSPKDCIMSSLFQSFNSLAELYTVYDDMIKLASRLLRPNGILVFKCMDIMKFGEQRWLSLYSIKCAEEANLELIDKFILIAKQKLMRNTMTQHCARKNHCYFLVFKKPSSLRKFNSTFGRANDSK